MKKNSVMGYMGCLKRRTQKARKLYCKDEFEALPGLKKKCLDNYCDFCCDRSVPWVHKNKLYTCKKQCNLISSPSIMGKKSASSSLNWMQICINVEKPEYSFYGYCDDNFIEMDENIKCKLDSCRVCCVTSDQFMKSDENTKNLENCFQKCVETFFPKTSKGNNS